MAIKISFDAVHNPETPTIVLAKKNGDKLGMINAKSIEVTDSMNDAAEISFNVHKFIDDKEDYLWDDIVDFRLAYCVEWGTWFEIKVEIDESNETVKTVFCTQLGKAELSHINLYNIKINTEGDPNWDITKATDEDYEYKKTVLYREDDPSASLLHRIMEKAPHYSVRYVDATIKNIQRTFEFDDTSIDDAFQKIAEEIHCLFVYDSGSDENGKPLRSISVYDLESNCLDCGYRGEFNDVCPNTVEVDGKKEKCGSTNISYYGEDTTVFVTSDELANDIQLEVNTEEVKNCFKLEAGDDLMTASIRNCNPNGSDYIWYISDATKADMSGELVDKIEEYDKLYEHYQNEHIFTSECPQKEVFLCLESSSDFNSAVAEYNEKIIDKYNAYPFDAGLQRMPSEITGYPSLMNAYYDTIDLELYLKSGLMPNVDPDSETRKTDAEEQGLLLHVSLPDLIAVTDIDTASLSTANSHILSMAKAVISSHYKVTINSSQLEDNYWSGTFIITNYSDENDTYTTGIISRELTDWDETYIKQKIEKILSKENTDDLSITGLFEKEIINNDNDKHVDDDDNWIYGECDCAFCAELKKYALNILDSFHKSCQACIDILIEQGVGDNNTWGTSEEGSESNLYERLYKPYYDKLRAIEAEMAVREEEIALISGMYDTDGAIKTKGLQNYIEEEVSAIQEALDFEEYLGEELWLEFCSFRREDKYSNDNYISDGLDNAEIFKKALEFFEVAENEIYKSAELQHSISANLKNLLVIKKFAPLVNQFQVGNWLRVMVDDKVYKIRLIEYSIDYDNLDEIPVEFSDAVKTKNSITDIQDVLSQSSSMASSYSSVKRQAKQGESSNEQLINWVDNGLSLTNMKIVGDADNQNVVWNSNGVLCREYLEESGVYDDRQTKIINKGLYVTNDGWNTAKAGIGNFTYYNPKTKQLEEGYGVIADLLVGGMMLSEEVGVYTENGSFTLDENGLGIVIDKEKLEDIEDEENKYRPFLIKDTDDNDIISIDKDGNLLLNSGKIIFGSYGGSNKVSANDLALSSDVASVVNTVNDANTTAGAANSTAQVANDTATQANTTATEAKSAAEAAQQTAQQAQEAVNTVKGYLSVDDNGDMLINGKPVNAAASATLSSSYSITSIDSHLPLSSIVRNGSAFSMSGAGVKVSYDGMYEISGHVCASELDSGEDVFVSVLKDLTVVQNCSATSSGAYQTVSITPTVVSLVANQSVYLNIHSTGGTGVVGDSANAVLTVKLLG